MDADTTLRPHFVANARRALGTHRDGKPLAGIGGVFRGDRDGWSLVRQLQENEYTRYARHLARRRGHALVLTGTGTLFNVGALREVVAARRNHGLPDDGGTREVYDTNALTEDNELTLCLKALGYATTSPMNCVVETAMMPTFSLLFRQRRRRQRGALENIASHGPHGYVHPYTARQALTYLGVLFLPLYLVTLAVAVAGPGTMSWFAPLWLAVGLTYVVEQSWSVRAGGWRAVVTSLMIVPEMAYAAFLDVVYVVSLTGMLASTSETWGRDEDRTHGESATQHVSTRDRDDASVSAVHATRWLGAAAVILVAAIVLSIPFVDLGVAWRILAIYALSGSVATLFRLVPLPMS